MQRQDGFPGRLRAQLELTGTSIYGLARTLDPDSPRRAERSIYRWLAGAHQPSQANRDAICDALNIERGVLEADEEGEESLRHLGYRFVDRLCESVEPVA